MSRRAFVIELRPDAIVEYVRRHQRLPEDLERATRASGIRNYSIFLHGSLAFGYFEADDVDGAVAAGAEDPNVVAWQSEMATLRADGATSVPFLDEIFHLD